MRKRLWSLVWIAALGLFAAALAQPLFEAVLKVDGNGARFPFRPTCQRCGRPSHGAAQSGDGYICTRCLGRPARHAAVLPVDASARSNRSAAIAQ
jgi:hypothetical protein